MNDLLLLEVMLSRIIAQEAGNSKGIMNDPFALSLMTVHAAIRRLQADGTKTKKNRILRKKKVKLALNLINRAFLELESI